ncbi:MAG: hypothetical protein ABR534_15460 [Desulfotignum sp.]
MMPPHACPISRLAVAVDECLLEQGLGHGGVDVVPDPVVQEQGLAGGGIDEQGAPEGRGMEEKSQGPEMFFSLVQEGGGKTGVWGGTGLHLLSAGHGRAALPGRV